jgi:hypothetical protein
MLVRHELDPVKYRRAERYFTRERSAGGSCGMNRYHHGRGSRFPLDVFVSMTPRAADSDREDRLPLVRSLTRGPKSDWFGCHHKDRFTL